MKKFLITFFVIFTVILSVQAKVAKRDLNSVINDSNINRSSIAISVKDISNGKSVFKLNEKTLMHPASVQKLLTIVPAVDALGENYEFTTGIYLRDDENYVIKLGADPYLKTEDLEQLTKNIDKLKIKKIYIDDSIIERKDWGEGWQWDDDLNTYMPKFNAYNLDKNLVKITVMPTKNGQQPFIINQNKYPMVFFNNAITGDKNNVKITRENNISSNSLTIYGTVNTPVVLTIPTENLARYFNVKLSQVLEDKNIYLKSSTSLTHLKSGDKKLKEISHPLKLAIDDILKNSNNMVVETLIKLASAKKYNTAGSDILGVKMFNDYCEKIGIDNSEIKIVDASGVSKNNIVNADFVTEYLYKNKDNPVYKKMATPGEGTLSARMLPLKDNLKAKTGTLSDISSIAGYITTQNGKKYTFCILINDPKSTDSDKKLLEDYLIRELYLRG